MKFTKEQLDLISSLKGILGGTNSEVVRTIVMSWLSEKSMLTKNLEIYVRRDSQITDFQGAIFEYAIQNKNREIKIDYTQIEPTILIDDCYVTIPGIQFDDHVSIRIKKGKEIFTSDWVVSNKRHLYFKKDDS